MGKLEETTTTTEAGSDSSRTCAQVVLARQESRSGQDVVVVATMERPPSSSASLTAQKDKADADDDDNDTSNSSRSDEEHGIAPPSLRRSTAARHTVSRVGAVAVAGPGDALSASAVSFGTEEEEEAAIPVAALDSHTTSGSSAATTTTTTSSQPPPPIEISVTATVVTDDDYQAELHRVLMRTAVRASKVETLPEEQAPAHDDEARKAAARRPLWYIACLLCTLFVGLGVASVLWMTGTPEKNMLRGTADTTQAPTAAPDLEQELVYWLKDRSFDGGEALREYASPQRTFVGLDVLWLWKWIPPSPFFAIPLLFHSLTHFALHLLPPTGIALRFIAAEFPDIPRDEKLVDLYAVATFFFSTGGTFWGSKTKWKSGDNVCTWYGIACDARGHVISIELPANSLGGRLPPELGLLAPRVVGVNGPANVTTRGLQVLNVAGNDIGGAIPAPMGLLTGLTDVFLQENRLSAEVPSQLAAWRALERVSLQGNLLDGVIPSAWCSLNNTTTTTAAVEIQVDCERVQCSCCTPACVVVPTETGGEPNAESDDPVEGEHGENDHVDDRGDGS